MYFCNILWSRLIDGDLGHGNSSQILTYIEFVVKYILDH